MRSLFIRPAEGAIFQPSSTWQVDTTADLLRIKEGDRAVDLGSGDGRVVIELAKRGAYSYGFEKDPDLIALSRQNIQEENLGHKAFVFLINFWEINLSSFNKIAVFQVDYIMRRLQEKMANELRSGALIVSQQWQFPNWKPIRNIGDIYLYKKS